MNHGLKFELYTYDDSLSVPDGVVLKDASDIYPEDELFTYRSGPGGGSVAVFANFFRYKLLYERGGWWVDTDVLYTGGSLPDGEVYVREDESKVNIAVLRFPKKSAVMERCLEKAQSIGKAEASKKWGKAGPELLTEVLEEEGREGEAFPKKCAYPVHWEDAEAVYLPGRKKEVEEKSGEGPFLHLWNEILGRMGIQKSVRPPEDSYLSEKAKEVDFTWPCSDIQYSAETIEEMAENWRRARKAGELDYVQSTLTWKIISYLHPVEGKVKLGLNKIKSSLYL